MTEILHVKNVSKKYNTIDGEIKALEDITFTVDEGEFVAIVGTSGCGKSTLLSILAGLEDKTSGDIEYKKDNIVTGYMLQDDALLEHMNIENNILLGLKIQKKLDTESRKYALDLLKKYDLDKFKDKRPSQLSGGMKQRVALIRTLAIKPDILFLDEAFSALDYTTRLNVSDDVYRIIKDTGKTTIMVTHDIGEAVSMADKVIVLSKGPAKIKNIYEIERDNKDIPTINRNDVKYEYDWNLISKDLNV